MPPTNTTGPVSIEVGAGNVETLNRLLDIGASNTKPVLVDGSKIPFIVIPERSRVESLAAFVDKPRPQFINSHPKMVDVDSFCDYVNRYKDDRTLIHAVLTEDSANITAVLDYHTVWQTEFCAHKVSFTTQTTPEFKTWKEADGEEMSQLQFAEWLEENSYLFVVPIDWPENRSKPLSGTDLLELVMTLQGKQDVRFTSGVRLRTGGSTLQFDEDIALTGGGGSSSRTDKMELPEFMVAGISPFVGSVKYQINARLKYRIESRKLTLRLETVQMHKVIRDSIEMMLTKVKDKTGIVPMIGQL